MRVTGRYQNISDLNYFIPDPLPPLNPPLNLTPEIMTLYGQASFALGQLNEMCQRLPDPKRFINAYVIKEALLSSAIEGIHTTLINVFTHQLGQAKPDKETQLVLNYIKALDAALMMIQEENVPLVSRVILHAHKTLMSGGVGEKADPGNYRKQSVRVGNLIPPPSPEIPLLMSALEKYMNSTSDLPPLVDAGLVHVQFETIHPFLDGNGRIGRLLIVLMLIDKKLLKIPILYPSYYFKKHHMEYYQALDKVRTHGDFEGWIMYYLRAIKDSAQDAYKRAKEIEELEKELKNTINNDKRFTKMRDTSTLVLNYLFTHPITNIADISERLEKAYNTVSNVLKQFIALEIVSEITINKRRKMYRFKLYLDLLEREYFT